MTKVDRPNVTPWGSAGHDPAWLVSCADAEGSYSAWIVEDSPARIEVMRFDSLGQAAWPAPVTADARLTPDRAPFAICSDGLGGVIVAYVADRGQRGGKLGSIVLQRLDLYGRTLWSTGAVLADRDVRNTAPELVTCGDGGAILAWSEGFLWGVRVAVQRVDSNGIASWREELLTPYHADQDAPAACSDGAGGAIICWTEGIEYLPGITLHEQSTSWCRTGEPIIPRPGPWLRAQRLDRKGHRLWGGLGVLLSDPEAHASLIRLVRTGDRTACAEWYQSDVGPGTHRQEFDVATGELLEAADSPSGSQAPGAN